jgi:uncharacterized protein YegL
MQSIIDEVRGSINHFLAEQRKDADKSDTVTVCTFDNLIDYPIEDAALSTVRDLTIEEYYARGSTSLYDAVGMTVAKLQAVKKKSDKVILVIATDGHENTSREYNHETFKALMKRVDKRKAWTVIYLAANQDAIAVGSSMGIAANSSFTLSGSPGSYNTAYNIASSTTSTLRSSADTRIKNVTHTAGVDNTKPVE